MGTRKCRRWTAKDDATMRRLWADHTPTQIAKAIGRSAFSVHARSRRIGLAKHYQHNYTATEDEIIRDCWKVMKSEEIASLLPGRSTQSVVHRAQRLSLDAGTRCGTGHIWTMAEEKALKQMSESGCSLDEMSERLNRSRAAVQQKRLAIGCTPMKPRRLSAVQIAAICEHLRAGKSTREVSALTGISSPCVLRCGRKHGVSNGRKRGRLSPDSDWGWTGKHPHVFKKVS